MNKGSMRFFLFIALSFMSAAFMCAASSPAQAQPASCDSDMMDVMKAAAWQGAQRDVELAERLILKPDSVLEYTCFNNYNVRLGENADVMFSDNMLGSLDFGSGVRRYIVDPYPESPKPPKPPAFDQGNLDRSLSSMVTDAMIQYLSGSFAHTYGGGVVGSTSGATTCNSMATVWQSLKCQNFDPDFFIELDDIVSNDPRTLPLACSNGSSSFRNTQWDTTNSLMDSAETLFVDP
jgi:hypothetical protein